MINFHPKKSLGQNFLINPYYHQKIISTGKVKAGDIILEIGPGTGLLTQELLKKDAQVFAIEKDYRAFTFLQRKFSTDIEKGRLILMNSDILNFNHQHIGLTENNYKLIANIPYYLTGKIIRQFLNKTGPKISVLLVQKEVADRIVCSKGKESILSLIIKIYGEAQKITTIKAGNFFPKPKVDSALLLIKKREKPLNINEEELIKLIKKGFKFKRKKVLKNLNLSEKLFIGLKLDLDTRAEDLKLNDWLNIYLAEQDPP